MSAAAKRTVLAAASILALVALSILVPVGGASSERRDSEPPTTPRNVRVAGVTPSLVRIAWDPSTDNVAVKGYYVFGDKGKATVDVLDDQGNPILDDDGKPIGDAPGFTVEWLGCGESTELTVIAYDASQNRSGKATVTVSTAACGDLQPPTAPSAFTQVATSTDSVVLAWAASSDNVGVVEYGVNRNLQRVATPTQPTVTLTGLSCGSTYEYAIDAADAAGNRSPLATAYVQTASCPSATDTISPSTPTGLAASNITETALALNWNASSDNVGVTGYDVYRNGTKVASVTSTSASQSGLSCGTSYPFAVRARDGAGRTSAAAQLTVSTAACSTTPPPTTDTISPSTPTGLAASNIAQSALALNWNASSDNVGVTGYDVYRNGARVASVTGTSVNQSTLSCGTSYPFAVRALDGAGRTSAAAQLTVSTADCSTTPPPTDTTPPSTPTGLAISSATRTSVSLTWNPATDNIGVAGYRLYVDGSLSVSTTQPATTVSNLSCGTTYTFAVDALDAAGNNSPQASVTGATAACADTQAPSAPTNVVASSRSATSIALSWSASSDNAGVAGYGLYRGGVAVGSTSTTTGIFAGLTCNTNYTLAVDAYDAAGNRSQKTTTMVATTGCADTAAPSTPTGLAASNITQTGLMLTWNASSDNVGVTGYDVYRGGTKMTTVTSPSSSQTGLACGTTYSFGVVARDAAGNSSAQVQLTASTGTCPTSVQPAALSWRPPGYPSYSGYVQVDISDTGQACPSLPNQTPSQYWICQLAPNTDYVLHLGHRKVTGANFQGLSITGGRNVVILGGEIEIPGGVDMIGADSAREALVFHYQTGIVHVEGVHIFGKPLRCLVLDARDAIFQIENVRCDGVYMWNENLSNAHSDVLLVWKSPADIRIDKFTSDYDNTGFALYRSTDGTFAQRIQLKRVNIRRGQYKYGGGILARDAKATRVDADQVYFETGYGRASSGDFPPLGSQLQVRDSITTYAPDKNGEFWSKTQTGDGISQGSYVTVPDDVGDQCFGGSGAKAHFEYGVPPGGDFVPTGVAGANYVSPGYQ